MTVSDYAKKETERVKTALPTLLPGDIRFAFLPDLHYKFIDEMKVSVANLVGALNELSQCEKIEFVCFGGDNVGNYPNSREEHIAMMRDLAERLSPCQVPVFFVQGNHDDNSIHGEIEHTHICRTGFEVTDDIQYEILFSLAERCPNYHAADGNALYGYYDAKEADTRIVFLNSSDMPYIVGDDGIIKYATQWGGGYTGKQLSWLCHTALAGAPTNVIFIEHIPFDSRYHKEDPRRNASALDQITKAFVRGEHIRLSSNDEDFGYEIDADFGGVCHNIPARIAGHCHFDSATVDESGFLSITTMLAGRKNSGFHPEVDGIKFEREPYSDKESAMDIFTFSPSRKTLFATRYGSGEDRVFPLA